jgi:serralysin
MASPFVQVDDSGNIVSNLGKILDPWGALPYHAAVHGAGCGCSLNSDVASGASGPGSEIFAQIPNGGVRTGSLDNEDGGDLIAIELVAGQTYTFSYRGVGDDAILDPYLRLIGTDGVTVLAEDDDGDLDRASQITFTATQSGTYYLNATSWYQADPTAPDFQDNGDYAIAIWSPDPSQDAGSTIATTTRTIGLGTNYEYIEAPNDRDFYAIQLVAGNLYTFTYNGGIFPGDPRGPGESVGVLGLFNAAGGTLVGLTTNTGGETTISYFATQTGTYYLRAEPLTNFANDPGPEATGGYTIDVTERPLSSLDPLDSIDWKSSDVIDTTLVNGVPTAKVYFALAGENFGERNGALPLDSLGWTDVEKAAVMDALKEYTKILGINYEITTNAAEAEFRLITTGPGKNYGAYMYPQDPAFGTQQGISAYNIGSGGWNLGRGTADQPALVKGGFAYAVILHEMGHGHGLAHPHDRGGGSDIMPGVTSASGTLGVFDLNQGIYTVMSYNDAWPRNPAGPSPFTIAGISQGWSGTLGAFDIAMLQKKYGVRPDYATGDDTYTLKDVNARGTYYETIYDTGGTDTIAYVGNRNATIDLLAATLDYTLTGGGAVSFASGIFGGYTIANGVVIENASGGSGNDLLLGNDVANVLSGNGGNDVLSGRGGADTLDGGEGIDTATYVTATAGVRVVMGNNFTGQSNDGDRLISIEKVVGSNFADELIGGNGADDLSGGAGNDTISGGNAADILNGDAGADILSGGNDNDVLSGGADNDTLYGGNGIDLLMGDGGADTIFGDNGDDRINGGAGDDMLRGGNGADRFLFGEGAGNDTIADFRRGDLIDFTALAGVDRSDLTINGNTIFVENGDDDFTITVLGDRITDSAFIFASAAASATMSGADMAIV